MISSYVKMDSKICLIYTGGTIGMAPRAGGGPLLPQALADLLRYLPGLQDVQQPELYQSARARALAATNASKSLAEQVYFLELADGNLIVCDYQSLERPVDSSDVGAEHWRQIIRLIAANYADYDGFVVLHGTDTMAFTASALSFALSNLGKPVVLTGSQLPLQQARGDAPSNLLDAIYLAGYRASGLACIPEVCIVLAHQILRGCRARKLARDQWDSFASPNYPILGNMGPTISFNSELLRAQPAESELVCIDRFGSAVFHLSLFPDLPSAVVAEIVRSEAIQGVVLSSYGAGNIPISSGLLEALQDAVAQGKVIVNLSQCVYGGVQMGSYEGGARLAEIGVLSGGNMTPEAAITKLMWLLGNYGAAEAARLMPQNLRGELG